MVLNFGKFVRSEKVFKQLTITIWTSAWRVPSNQSTTRYQESQGSLGVVIDWIFSLGGVDLCASLLINHRHVSLFLEC